MEEHEEEDEQNANRPCEEGLPQEGGPKRRLNVGDADLSEWERE